MAFDLDDTLAVSKSQIDPRMAELLERLLDEVEVCIISGGRFEQFDSQVLRHLRLADAARPRLHLMPTCGTRYYRWMDGGWGEVYAEDLSKQDKDRIIAVLTEGAKELGLWEANPWGEIIEDFLRGELQLNLAGHPLGLARHYPTATLPMDMRMPLSIDRHPLDRPRPSRPWTTSIFRRASPTCARSAGAWSQASDSSPFCVLLRRHEPRWPRHSAPRSSSRCSVTRA